MSELLQFELVSPEEKLVSEPVRLAVIPGEAGEMGVGANHASIVASLKPGVVTPVTICAVVPRISARIDEAQLWIADEPSGMRGVTVPKGAIVATLTTWMDGMEQHLVEEGELSLTWLQMML